MVLESWGLDVGLVLVRLYGTRAAWIPSPARCCSPPGVCMRPTPPHPSSPQIMDTPRPDQIRTAQPQAAAATEGDSLELMEMILGALGRDALGLGSSIAHPRESEEWRGMTMQQRFEFFAPIWRVMVRASVLVGPTASAPHTRSTVPALPCPPSHTHTRQPHTA